MIENRENQNNMENKPSGPVKDWFRKYVLNNLGIKIISIIVAVIVWMLIINIEDPYKEKVFTVTVETINEEALSSVNMVYEIIEGSTAQVTVRGKKSVVDKLRPDDIKATADLSDLSAVNAVAIVPKLIKNVSSEPVLECDQVLKVALEEMSRKQVKVTVVTEGTPDVGFSIGDCTARPNMVEVTGGQSAINKIDSVRVTVNVNGASEDFVKRVKPKAYDANGEEVVSSTLTYSSPKVRATIRVLRTKSIPVNINIKGEPAQGYEFIKAACLPERIEVAGSDKVLNTIEKVEIPIDITGMKSSSGSIEQNISIQDYLPAGIAVLSEYAQVSLRIEIEQQVRKTLEIPVEHIKFASLNKNLLAEITEDIDTVELVVQGRASVLESLQGNSFTAYVDCENLKKGIHKLEVKIDLGDICTLVKSEKISVGIFEMKNSASNQPAATPKNTQAPQETQDVENMEEESENTQE